MANNLLGAVRKKSMEAQALKGIQETDVKDMPTEIANQIIYVKDENLLDDEYNTEIYGTEEDEKAFVESIRTNGFKGVILAYSVGEGKYKIESGHRRRRHGRSANMTEFPVIVTETPTSEWQRKRGLVVNNRYNRSEEPLNIAREIKMLLDAHTERIAEYEKAKEGGGELEQLDASGRAYPTGVIDCVVIDMGLTRSQISQYKQLLELSFKLQSCISEKLCPWSGLHRASKLKPETQDMLAQIIRKKALEGTGEVTKQWLQVEVENLSHRESMAIEKPEEKPEEKSEEKTKEKPNDIQNNNEQSEQQLENRSAAEAGSISGGTRQRRTFYLGRPIFTKAMEFEELLNREGKIKSTDIENLILVLERMKKVIDTKIESLKKSRN